jgi:hypothetical protein
MNPEFRQRLNTISRNLESANETAAENIYTFTQLYIDPCITGFKLCFHDCTAPCLPDREERLRRRRGRSHGRADLSFEFYDDWDEDEDAGNNLVGWGNGELDSLLAGSRTVNKQPDAQRGMSYGSRGRLPARIGDDGEDTTIVPSSSYFGFLERLPFKIGARGLRYKPSAADLQENPGGLRIRDAESDPLIEGDETGSILQRPRSGTAGSRETQGSLSSRGDLIPSDEEEDAVPLDDEFAVALSRRITNDGGSGRSGKRPRISQTSTRTVSSKSTRSGRKSRRSNSKKSEPMSPQDSEHPSMVELSREEDKVRIEEELEVEQKRRAAQRAAMEQGLVKEEPISLDGAAEVVEIGSSGQEAEPLTSRPRSIPSRRSSGSGPEPFPEFSTEEHADEPEPP